MKRQKPDPDPDWENQDTASCVSLRNGSQRGPSTCWPSTVVCNSLPETWAVTLIVTLTAEAAGTPPRSLSPPSYAAMPSLSPPSSPDSAFWQQASLLSEHSLAYFLCVSLFPQPNVQMCQNPLVGRKEVVLNTAHLVKQHMTEVQCFPSW